MSRSAKTYYKILEVDSEASLEVIEAAYRRLARRFHPDLNPSPDATARMQEINEAYSVLSDSQKRTSYDVHLRVQAEAQARRNAASTTESTQAQSGHSRPPRPEPEPQPQARPTNPFAGANMQMPAVCQYCGRSDASLRFAAFPFVISLLIVTLRRGDSGLYCTTCRRQKMSSAKILTFLFGWWGIPWGPIYTLMTLFTSNEGVIDAQLNADYLRWLGGYFLHRGNLTEAKSAIQASLNLRHDPALAAAAHAIFGKDLMPSRAKLKPQSPQKWVIPTILALLAGWLLFSVYLGSETTQSKQTGTALTRSQPTAGATAIAQSTVNVDAKWRHLKVKDKTVELDYPSNWSLVQNNADILEISGADTSFVMFVMPDNAEAYVNATIDTSKEDPDFVEYYNKSLRTYLQREFEKRGGDLIQLGSPVIEAIGTYSTISNDVVYTEFIAGKVEQRRLWLYLFDCGIYLCQVMYSKYDSSAITKEQQRIVERVIASIQVGVTPALDQTAATPKPTLTANLPNTFSELSFCYERNFSILTKKCRVHRSVFTGMVERLYVSWTPSDEYKGASFLKVWYFDGNFIFESESASEYAYIEVDTRSSLKPGKYQVDVYVADTLVASSGFIIR